MDKGIKYLQKIGNKTKIGVIICTVNGDFFNEIINGITASATKLSRFGVEVILETRGGSTVFEQMICIKRLLKLGINGLVIVPASDGENDVDSLNSIAGKIPLIYLNRNIEGARKLTYIGCDYETNGRAAAHMLALMLPDGGNVEVFTSRMSIMGYNRRIVGFSRAIKDNDYKLRVSGVHEYFENDDTAFVVTDDLLKSGKKIDAVYIISSQIDGIMNALVQNEYKGKVITVDESDTVRRYIQTGLISATVCQSPYRQGYLSLEVMFDYIAGTRTEVKNAFILDSYIKLKDTLYEV